MKEPLISVIIPAYRCADYISRAIDSALSQDVALEVIVIDDCSDDDLDGVMATYAGNSSVIYAKNQQNLGAAQSRNRGVAMARGRYVAFLDGDDCWRSGKLQKQLAAIERCGAVLCATGRELMTPEGECTGRVIPVKTQISYRDLLKHNCINCSSVVLETVVAREFPMHHEDSHEDYILWLRILQKYKFACAVNEPLLLYRLSTTGKSGNKLHSAKMTFRVYRYMGFGWIKSCACFCSYAIHGVYKYWRSRNGEKYEA